MTSARLGKMNEISVGAVGAATIAGLVSLIGLVIGKEQKVSEFRQAWIDDLRKCLVAYLVNINSISDAIRLKKSGSAIDDDLLISNYKSLNEASHGITLRINPEEDEAIALQRAMSKFEAVANANSTLTPEKIREVEAGFIDASKDLLKFEWDRVKRGEDTFVWTKRIVIASIVGMVALLGYLWMSRSYQVADTKGNGVQVFQTMSADFACSPTEMADSQAPGLPGKGNTAPLRGVDGSKNQPVRERRCTSAVTAVPVARDTPLQK